MKHRRILVTGGAGFIGSALVLHLLKQPEIKVLNVDALTYAGCAASLEEAAKSPEYAFAQCDVCDLETLRTLVAGFRPDAIMHLAAESHVDRSIDGPLLFVRSNVTGTAVMLQAALEYWRTLEGTAHDDFRFLHVSTDEVFGQLGAEGFFHEETPYDPSSPYSASKAAADHLVRAWHRTYGLPVLITNCSNNYGPRQFPEKLMPLCIINAMEGRELPVYGSGSNVRDWLYVEDHVRALCAVLEGAEPGSTWLVGGNSERTNLQVVQAICRELDLFRPREAGSHAELIRFVADRPGHDARYAIDAGKLRSQLGWKPEVAFEEGIRLCVRWYAEHTEWWRPLREKRYGGERLGGNANG